MSSRRKTSLATVQRSGEDLIVKSVRIDDGVYTECADSDEGGESSIVDMNQASPEAPLSPPLPMSPLTSESNSGVSEEEEQDGNEGEEEQDDDEIEEGEEEPEIEVKVEQDGDEIEEEEEEPEIEVKVEQDGDEIEEEEEPDRDQVGEGDYEEVEEEDESVGNDDGENVPSPIYEEEPIGDELPSTPFTRNYSCSDCSFHTQNPRTHLYHLRDVHGAKGKIYECKYCVYASNHSQKVNRHVDKCHASSSTLPVNEVPKPVTKTVKPEPFQFLKNLLLKEKEEKASASAAKNESSTIDDEDVLILDHNQNGVFDDEDGVEDEESSHDDDSQDDSTDGSVSDVAELEAEEKGNSDNEVVGSGECEALGEDEERYLEGEDADTVTSGPETSAENGPASGVNGQNKSVQHRCTICNYTTRIRSRFTKHVRYHSMPLIKCSYCDFKTPYKWNLDRHYRSHTGEGSLHCPLCNFSADIKQSITVHIQNHHENLTPIKVLELVQSLDKGASPSLPGQSQVKVSPTETHVLSKAQMQRGGAFEKLAKLSSASSGINSSSLRNLINPNEIIDKNGKIYLKKFKCKYCTFKAIWESELNRHLRRTHGIATRSTPITTVATASIKPKEKVESCNVSNTNMTAPSLCPNVVYSYGDGDLPGSQSETLTNCEYCSETFNSDEELLLHQNNCAGLAKIHEWNGGLLWSENGDDSENIDTTGGKKNLENNNEAITTKKKVYRCPHENCQFWAITASRFHVHMVGHNNSKPFECSLCFYKSNWRWDIAKHIKLKSMRDSEHLTARVLLTHESGERNYKEYDQYLTLMKVKHSADSKLPDCSTKAEKRNDIEMEMTTDDMDGIADNIDETMPKLTMAIPVENVAPAKASGLSQHNFLKPSVSAPRRFVKNNFLREVRPSVSSTCNSTLPGNSSGEASTSTSFMTENSSPPSKILKLDEATPIIWKCKKCPFRHTSKEAVFLHLRQSHNMRKSVPVSILKNNLPPTLKSEVEESEHTDVNLNGTAAVSATTAKETHQYAYNDDGSYSCKFCPFSTIKLNTMIIHSENHFSKAYCSFSCDFCSYSVASQEALYEHLILHKSKIEMTETALPETRIPRFLKQHFAAATTVSPNKKYSCVECPYVTDSRGQFHYHNQFHTTRDSLYKCSECSYNVSHKHLLHQHIRVHQIAPIQIREEIAASSSQASVFSGDPGSGDQLMICDLCPSRFFKVVDLQVHSIFHERQSPLQCSDCSYSVRKPLHLKAHLKVHSAEYQQRTEEYLKLQPIQTPVPHATRVRFQEGDDEACEGNPAFQYPTHIKNGKLKEKRYKCKKCPSAFEKRDQYKVHVGLHGSRQRYQCTVCDYAVTFYANFIQHLKKHRSQAGVPEELLVSLPISKRGLGIQQPSFRISPPTPMVYKRKVANFRCEHCNYETRQKHLMDDHKTVMHPEEQAQDAEFEEYSHSSFSNSEVDPNDMAGVEVEAEIYEEDGDAEASGKEDEVMDEESIAYEDDQDEVQQNDEDEVLNEEVEDGNEELEEDNELIDDGIEEEAETVED